MNNFFRKTRRHFLPCEDTAGGSQLSGGEIIFSQNKEVPPVAGSNPNLDHDYIWCYATLQVMKLTYPTFASPLLYLLCLASEALAAATMSAGCSSTCSSVGNNQICASRNPYHRLWVSSHPHRHAHRSRLLIATRCRWCGATAANHAESSVASQPQSATLAESSTNARIMG